MERVLRVDLRPAVHDADDVLGVASIEEVGGDVSGVVVRLPGRVPVGLDVEASVGLPFERLGDREVLAAALGVSAGALSGLDGNDVSVALSRINAVAHRVRHLEDVLTVDDLTGVLSRSAGLAAVRREMERAHRRADPLSIVVVDVAELGKVNDETGYGAGERLLCAIAEAIRGRVRTYDVVARIGGDQFLAALCGADRRAAESIAADIMHAVDSVTAGRVRVGITSRVPVDTVESMLDRAMAALGAPRRTGTREPR
jgi:diguanylate cyclase (GGDEF)-like protein